LNTALILSGNEIKELITLCENDVSMQLRHFVNKTCDEVSSPTDIASALQKKRLARWDGHTLTLEPFLKLIIDEACAATSLYEPTQDSFALECPNMHLHFTRYEWAENKWRIAPFKDRSQLFLSLT